MKYNQQFKRTAKSTAAYLRRYAYLMRIRMPKNLFLNILALLTLGCVAAGVPYTEDPYKKISYAYELMNQGRYIPSEKLGHEALAKFTEQGNRTGIAEAHILLGQLYKHPAYSVPPASDKSALHSQQALDIFVELGNFAQATKAQFAIANAYIERDKERGCSAYDDSLKLYEKGKKINPGESFQINPNFKDFPDMVKAFKDEYCK